jgi:D-cysteine desulfhydrase family pyridoxal phosphate-dependent enzyme
MRLAQLPTPLQEAPRLSERLGMRILIKRDDQTGLALGGNKARKLEFLIAAALAAHSDAVITTGGSQSNHARMTAAACRLAGMDCFLVLDRGVHPEDQGNLLLDRLLGANVTLIESDDPAVAAQEMESLAEQLRRRGRRPYLIPRGGSIPEGATAYTAFVPELLQQLADAHESVRYLYVATGSTGTHSGILAGLAAVGASLAVQGISVSRAGAQQRDKVLALANATLRYLGLSETITEAEVCVDDRFRGPGYGHPTPQTMEAIEMVARDEALLLDPVYTGKAMAGLIEHAREGRFSRHDTVVFLHTGGALALFAYHSEVIQSLAAGQR